jgi:hypothetical protein
MGFQHVILIGVDHNFTSRGEANKTVVSQGDDPNHFAPNYFGKGARWQLPDLDTSEVGYTFARGAYQKAGREVLDAIDVVAALVDDAQAKVAKGFTAVKINVSEALPPIPGAADLRAMVSRVESLRIALGDGVDIALDFHGRLSTAATRQLLPLLEPLLPLFVEEPVLPEFSRDLRRIVESTSIPIAIQRRIRRYSCDSGSSRLPPPCGT